MNTSPLLILAAHGAGDDSAANRRACELAEMLAASRRDIRVVAAFKLGTLTVRDALAEHGEGRSLVLPLMTSAGYFAAEYLRTQIGNRHAELLPAIGTGSGAHELIVRRIGEQLAAHRLNPRNTQVVIVGHGTRRAARSSGSTVAAADRVRVAYPELDVRAAFLDNEPLLENVAAALDRPNVLAFPFLIGGGEHVLADIPARLKAAVRSRVRILPAFGDDSEVPGLIAAAAERVLPRPAMRIGTRTSRLAMWQANAAARALESAGVRAEIVGISTQGDRDRGTALESFPSDGPFTDDLERALLRGEIDAAVHSCKDLPEKIAGGTRIGAYLERGSVREALVSRDGRPLRQLAPGARVGTCSSRREAQIRRLRPDLRFVPIRGTVEERVGAVRRGEVDATVLAAAGLERLGLEHEIAEVFGLDVVVPEAGQGAIVLQVREEDGPFASDVHELDHAPTRRAVEVEREFARETIQRTGLIAAAAMTDGVLHGRVVSRDGATQIDVQASNAREGVHDVVRQLRRRGVVWLVGAGPGDPGLITVRGLELLRMAEVVVYDRLANPALLDEAPASAERVDVGKSPRRHTMSQDEINAILAARGSAGKRVVRLKGGDPFVYGRGWEELEACRAANVRCEVVPGVTSAIAAPAAAGVPVTARGVARTFAIVTPQSEHGTEAEPLNYAALAQLDTVSVLMGRGMLAEVAAGLVRAGRPPSTPAAIVQNGTLAGQRVVRGELATIADLADEHAIGTPAVLIVGDVAGLALEHAGPRGRLAGKRIVVTRPRSASAGLIAMLRSEGAQVIDCPLIRIEYIHAADARMLESSFAWIVFTSLHGVRGFWKVLQSQGLDARAFGRMGARIAAVGPKTADELRLIGVRPDLIPQVHRASALIEDIAKQSSGSGQRVLFPSGTLARDELRSGLRRRGFHVEELPVYDTLDETPSIEARKEIERGFDAVMLYCPSAVRSATNAGLPIGRGVLACIGPTTADAARGCGLSADVVAQNHTDAGLIDELAAHLASRAGMREVMA